MLFREDHDSYSKAILDASIRAEHVCATPQSAKDFELLQRHPGGFTLGSQPELLHYASILLRAQDRIEEVLQNKNLCKRELIWTALYPHLRAAGYTLPLRYAPLETRVHEDAELLPGRLNRALDLLHMNILPAVCKRTGDRVVLKLTCNRANTPCSQELEILRLLNEEPLRSHPDNFAVRLLAIVNFPNIEDQPRAANLHIIVMPMLQKLAVIDCAINGFALHLMRQSFRAVAFLHSIGICHRDIGAGNLMMTSSDHTPYRLQLIDFGYAQQFDLCKNTISVRWNAGQIPPPEVEADPEAYYDPFSGEIFALAETWKEKRLTVLPLDAVALLDRMASLNPAARPMAVDCVRALEQALTRVRIRQQCQPTDLFKIQFQMDLRDEHDLRACARSAWNYARAVSSYIFCRGWKYLD